MTSHDYFDKPAPAMYEFDLISDSLWLTGSVSDLPSEYQLKAGSRADVLGREKATLDLFRRWTRHLLFVGDEEYTFRPDGYYLLKTWREVKSFGSKSLLLRNKPENSQPAKPRVQCPILLSAARP